MTNDTVMSFCSMFIATIGLALIVSCGSNNSPQEDINEFCIRLCVEETGEPEICDDRCKCAADDLMSKYSDKEITELTLELDQKGPDYDNSLDKLRKSFNSCANQNM